MKYCVTAILLLCSLVLSAQDISGKWTGWLSQQTGGIFPNYYFEMELVTDGDWVEGTSYDHVESGVIEHWCTFTVEGTFDSITQTFSFVETGEVESVTLGMPQPRGCIIQGDLQYSASADMEYLIGDWTGVVMNDEETACPPGRIYLERPRVIIPEDTIPEPVFPEFFEDREVVYDKNYNVWQTELDIVVWDNNIIDGDIISLSFNGEWILQNYELVGDKKTIHVTIRENGENVLILHAENEGDIPPNTAAIRVYDGSRTKMYTLSSDMESSGALMITHTPRED